MPVYKDIKRNTWFFRVYVVDDKTGETKQKCRSGFKTKSEAKLAEYNLINNEIDNNNILFSELYEIWLKDKQQKVKTRSFITIKNRFENHILPFFKDYRIYNIKAKNYIEWKEYILNKNLSYKYNSSLHVWMVNILKFAINFYELDENVAQKVGNFSKRDYIPKVNFWTIEEFKKFINSVDDYLYYTLFTFLFNTGMRIGECLALKWEDVENNVININKTLVGKKDGIPLFNSPKTVSSFRKIKIDDFTYSILNKLKSIAVNTVGYSDNWFVFGNFNPLSTTTVERKKNLYCKKANVKQIKIHDFRHSHATLLLSKGLPVTVISKRLGHSDISMTLNTYSHFIPEDEDKAIILLNQIFK